MKNEGGLLMTRAKGTGTVAERKLRREREWER